MICPKCGKENAEGAAFCNACGARMEAQKINNSFLQCLEQIITIEQRKMIQDKTIQEITQEIDQLGIEETFQEPVKQKVYKESVHYTLGDYWMWYEDFFVWLAFSVIGGIAGALAGPVIGWFGLGVIIGFDPFHYLSSNHPVLNWCKLCGICAFLVCLFISLLCFIKNSIQILTYKANDAKKIEIQYQQEKNSTEETYQKAFVEYQTSVAEYQERIIYENSKKRTLTILLEQMEQKSQETETLLAQYYDVSGLYETYRNLIAVSHIYEYLKSGICTKLGGIDGAYKVFKDEMYQKYQLERLDSIIGMMEQLHFDNMTLNSSLGQIAGQVSRLADSVDDFRIAYHDASLRAENQLSHLSDRLSSFEKSYAQNCAISQYNQQCIEAELSAANWLEVYKLSLDR